MSLYSTFRSQHLTTPSQPGINLGLSYIHFNHPLTPCPLFSFLFFSSSVQQRWTGRRQANKEEKTYHLSLFLWKGFTIDFRFVALIISRFCLGGLAWLASLGGMYSVRRLGRLDPAFGLGSLRGPWWASGWCRVYTFIRYTE